MPSPEPRTLGTLLRRFRRAAGMSQEALAGRSGVSARTISDLERGQRPSAHFETLRLLADALELAPVDRANLIRAGYEPWVDITLQKSVAAAGKRRRLPRTAARVMGRDEEISAVVAAVTSEASRLVTLTGPGGVGKTRLAQAVIAAVPALTGGIAWVDLSSVFEPGTVLSAIASGLGAGGADPEPADELVPAFVGELPFLLVLDNFEQVLGAAPVVVSLLEECPGLTVLVTSRVPLNVSFEIVVPVSPLDLPAPSATIREIREAWSVRLFTERARRAHPGFALNAANSETVAAICRQLGGLPLAIELAAARIRVMTPEALLDRLEHPLALLSRGPVDAPLRQQTMRNTIAWSYDLLDHDGQRLLRMLSVFVSGFTIETVEWVSGLPVDAAADALATLVESGLVTRVADPSDGGRFTMFPAVREYAQCQLVELQEDGAAYERLVSYCRRLSFYGEEVPTCIVPAEWAALMDRERGNIRAAYRHLAEGDDPEQLLEFTGTFGHFLYNRGPYQEAWHWIRHALEVSSPEPRLNRLQVLYWATHFASHLGLAEEALRYGEEARQMATLLGDRKWQAAAVHCLGLIQHELGAYDRATDFFNEELRLWSDLGIRGLSGFAYLMRGMIEFEQGDLVTARRLETQAAAIFRDMGGSGWVAMATWWQGLIAVAEHDLREAAEKFADTLRLSVKHDAFSVQHRGLVGLAFVASELTMYETAADLITAVDARLEDTGYELGRFEKLLYRAASIACRSRSEQVSESARLSGAATDPQSWLVAAESVRQEAARWSGEQGLAATRIDDWVTVWPHAAAD